MGAMNPHFPQALINRIDHGAHPDRYSCQFCGGTHGKTEEVWTGARDSDADSGFEIWFCCDVCLESGKPCETFFPIRLKQGDSTVGNHEPTTPRMA